MGVSSSSSGIWDPETFVVYDVPRPLDSTKGTQQQKGFRRKLLHKRVDVEKSKFVNQDHATKNIADVAALQ